MMARIAPSVGTVSIVLIIDVTFTLLGCEAARVDRGANVQDDIECPADFKRAHCETCGKTENQVFCKACSGNYTLAMNASSPDQFCTFSCSAFIAPSKPGMPIHAQMYNGVDWPPECFDEDISHFFTIGDWGGICGWGKDTSKCTPGEWSPAHCAGGNGTKGEPCPSPNRINWWKGNANYVDSVAQHLVSDRMNDRAKQLKQQGTPPRYIVNVGDNFYNGGLDVHCGLDNSSDTAATLHQFQQSWKDIYTGELSNLEWWSILGNHDYGGKCYVKGWDQQIYYTWHDDKWVMPAQYWKRSVHYRNFKVDFFFVDGNVLASLNADHGACTMGSNPGPQHNPKSTECIGWPGGDSESCGASGPQNVSDCKRWFQDMWKKEHVWLKDGLMNSDADWQILVNHYPATYNFLGFVWKDFLEPMGVDLYISGHTHFQRIYYGDSATGINSMGATAWTITGGGGGITSENLPDINGNDDQYGFMDVEISLSKLHIRAYTHGGKDGKLILRRNATVVPVERTATPE